MVALLIVRSLLITSSVTICKDLLGSATRCRVCSALPQQPERLAKGALIDECYLPLARGLVIRVQLSDLQSAEQPLDRAAREAGRRRDRYLQAQLAHVVLHLRASMVPGPI